jgi:hypothetical protein
MKTGDRVFVSSGSMAPKWLTGGRRGLCGVLERFVPGQNDVPAAVVKLDEPLEVDGARGQYLQLDLRYVGRTWDEPMAVASAELCDFLPDDRPWQERPRGFGIESHTTLETEESAVARGVLSRIR